MTAPAPAPRIFGTFATTGSNSGAFPAASRELALGELSVSFVPLAFVAEWARCSETADFVARFFAHDFENRDVAGNVLSTIVNELVENVVKFSSDKAATANLTVREYADCVTISTTNVASPTQAASFGETVTRIVGGDPEALFAEQLARPPATGSAGIGLIMLRKDYGATIGARIVDPSDAEDAVVDVEVTIENREVGQP